MFFPDGGHDSELALDRRGVEPVFAIEGERNDSGPGRQDNRAHRLPSMTPYLVGFLRHELSPADIKLLETESQRNNRSSE
jgi:hypothetical protein